MTQPYIGEIRLFGFNFAPKNWAMCNGQILSIATNTALFSILGTTYGGNGIQTFALPDFRGRTPIHWGASPVSGTNYVLGQLSGAESVTLSTQQIPAHVHQANAQNSPGASQKPNNKFISRSTTASASSAAFSPTATNLTALAGPSISQAGGSQPHSNIQPYTVLTFGIALFGIFPSRN